MPELCDLARRAMADRLIELAAGSHVPSQETETLQESLRHLFVLERLQTKSIH